MSFSVREGIFLPAKRLSDFQIYLFFPQIILSTKHFVTQINFSDRETKLIYDSKM